MISTQVQKPQITAWAHEAVSKFDEGGDDIFIVERPVLLDVVAAIGTARIHDWRALVTVTEADALVAKALKSLRIACPSLAIDIASVSRSFLAQFGVSRASLRVELVDTASCPKFHCDNIRSRVVTTYHGPGTEYVFVATPDEVQRAPTGSLMFLKGHKHPTHADAVLHRSPVVPHGEKRLCVVLDV